MGREPGYPLPNRTGLLNRRIESDGGISRYPLTMTLHNSADMSLLPDLSDKTIKLSTVYINLPFDKSPVLLTTVSILVNIQHHYECGIQSPNMPLSEC